MIRAMVVDDEEIAREQLAEMLAREPGVEIAGKARNGIEALEMEGELHPDVLFLDIEMPVLNGFDVVRALNEPPLIVFATAFDEYAVKAFEANAIDYLLKPVQAARVKQCVSKLLAAVDKPREASRDAMSEVLSLMARERRAPPSRIAARKGKRIVLLGPREIYHISIEEKLVFAHTATDRHLLDKTVSQMEELLGNSGFFRISRADLVNLEHVRELIPWLNGNVRLILRNGRELDVSRDRMRDLKEALAL